MSEPPVAEAVVRERRRISFVWIVPIVAALIGAFLSYRAISERGPQVTITFESASGLEAGKTLIKFKDVEIGKVESIQLAEDLSQVVVKARLVKDSQRFLKEETRFWVERARVSAGQVSGLGTLLSGAFIGIDPVTEGRDARKFVGLETPPVFTSEDPGTLFSLRTDSLDSIDVGTPVYFRWIEVGQVTHQELDESGNHVNVQIFVQEPHDARVRSNTRFWNSSGFDATLSPEGFQIDTVSLTSLLIGGVSFETPRSTSAGDPEPDQVFTLFPNKSATEKPVIRIRRPFLLFFDQSVAGLVRGAPVEFRGVQIGEVVDLRLAIDPETGLPRIPVRIALEPERLNLGISTPEEFRAGWDLMVSRGLRAQLKTNNVLTGQLAVSFEFFPDAEPAKIDWGAPTPEVPTISGGIDRLMAGLSAFTEKLNTIPLEQIGKDLEETVSSLNAVLAGVETATPALVGTLENAEQTLGSANALIASESPFNRDLQRTLRELADAARSLRLLAEELEQQPESLLRGKETDR
jgi:paraquat-inducible protein B